MLILINLIDFLFVCQIRSVLTITHQNLLIMLSVLFLIKKYLFLFKDFMVNQIIDVPNFLLHFVQ